MLWKSAKMLARKEVLWYLTRTGLVMLVLGLALALLSGPGETAPTGWRSSAPSAATKVTRRDLVANRELTGMVERTSQFAVRRGASVAQAIATNPGTPELDSSAAAPMALHRSSSNSATSGPGFPGPLTPSPEPGGPAPTSPPVSSQTPQPPGAPAVTVTVRPPPVTVTVTAPAKIATGAPNRKIPAATPPGVVPDGSQPLGPATAQPMPPTPAAGRPPTSANAPASRPDEPGGSSAADRAVLTHVAAVGTPVVDGTALYSADAEPVLAIIGNQSWWRELRVGSSAGPDVLALERALHTMGYGAKLRVDSQFTAATAEAVRNWERAVKRRAVDGRVAPTEVISVPVDTEVAQQIALGAELPPNTQILTLSTKKKVVSAQIDADLIAEWPAKASVSLAWDGQQRGPGRMGEQARFEIDDQVRVVITADSGLELPTTGSEVQVQLIRQTRRGVLAVPVAAIRANRDGLPVIATQSGSQRREISVRLGLVAQGWVEISGQVSPGTLLYIL